MEKDDVREEGREKAVIVVFSFDDLSFPDTSFPSDHRCTLLIIMTVCLSCPSFPAAPPCASFFSLVAESARERRNSCFTPGSQMLCEKGVYDYLFPS